jgi:hypothetical protein
MVIMFSKTKVRVNGDTLIIDRNLWPEEVVQGYANVTVFLDEKGRIVAIQIDFIKYGYMSEEYISEEYIERNRNLLKKARW